MIKFATCCLPLHTFRRFYARKVKENIAEMKYLNVAEKNDAAKTIAGQLSNGTATRREGRSVYNKIYEFETNFNGANAKMVMTSVSGHLQELAFLNSYRNWTNVDPQSLFDAPLRKVCIQQFEPIKQTLEREVRSCQGLIIWTDCDREGENIGFEIIDVCRAVKPNITVYRAIFSEITGASVKRALRNLARPDKRQSDAVEVRTELDLRTGAAITRFQTMRLQRLFPEKISDKLISYGSCQIPTLGFVAERYKEIEAFVSEPFWKIKVIHTIDDLTVEFNWARNRLFDKQQCEDFFLLCLENPKATVEMVTVKPKNKWRPTPMDTVELEKLGSRKLKLPAKEVMTIAEKLYTKGIISYPRTETNMFSKEIDLKSLVQQQVGHGVWGSFAERVIEWGPNPRNGSKSDQAHPPIHPTKMVPHMDGNEGRVYELICRHFLACVSKDATGSETIVNIKIAGEKFSASGLVIFERNYLDVYIYEKWNAKQIHKYEQGQEFDPTEITMPEGRTTAPPLLTEADLIGLMEKHGIGTDATHAEHINKIKERGYIGVVENGGLVPGVIGMGLYEGYDAMELVLAKPVLRAAFEVDLKKICSGEKDPKEVLREQIVKYKEAYKQIVDKIIAMDEKMSQRIQETPTQRGSDADGSGLENNAKRWQELFKCPKCSTAPLALKQKNDQTGHFIGCLNYPNCKHCIWFPSECKDPSVLDDHCPKCGEEYKLLKLRFTHPYHKALFNSPNGWYKTCLRCDTQFRNTFNINIESVKRTGPIVGDSVDTPINYGTASGTMNAGRPNSKSLKSKRTDETNTKNKREASKSAGAKKLSKTKQQIVNTTNIRSFFSAASSAQQSLSDIAREELRNVPLNELFDSNDGFEDLISGAEANIPTSASVTTSHVENVLPNDVAAVFNDNEDEFLSSIQWGTNDRPSLSSRSSIGPNSNSNTHFENSFSAVFDEENDFGDDYVWGSAAKNARVSMPVVKKPRLHSQDTRAEEDYSWGSSTQVRHSGGSAANNTRVSMPALQKPRLQSQDTRAEEDYSWGSSTQVRHSQQADIVKCSGCHQPAKDVVVKKEGPNKGRIFYTCAKSNPCKFFQWSDEVGTTTHRGQDVASTSHSTTQSWGSSSSTTQSWGSNSSTNVLNCNCNKPANSLTVRKEGPNKGKAFYACSNRDKSCGFFQWADENENQSQAGTSSSRPPGGTKTRKCGLCRQEGHSRQKCPRKAEFEF